MTLHQKVDDAWVQANRAYTLYNGVWTSVSDAYVKVSGVWTRAYEYDVTPPNPPEIVLAVNEDFDTIRGKKTLKTRYILVGIRLPGSANDSDARLSRVLTNYGGKEPTTQFGGTYTAATDASYPSEPWSEWRYNSYGPHHKDTSLYQYKQWPRNAASGTIIPGDQTYYFNAWSLDNSGNWSAVQRAVIKIPKASVDMPNILIKEARFQPDSSGSWTTGGFVSGSLVQQKNPRSQGLWFYGNQFTDSIGYQTTAGEKITIREAQIYIRREDDNGAANANVYLFRTAYGTIGALPAPGSGLVGYETTKLGTLAKGQGKWFELPDSFKNNLNKDIKGMGLNWKDPIKADAFPEDYSSVVGTATNLRCGEVHVVWEEER